MAASILGKGPDVATRNSPDHGKARHNYKEDSPTGNDETNSA